MMLGRTLNLAARQQRGAIQRAGTRAFSTKHEDLSIEGRYSSALMTATTEKKNLDKVFNDLSHVRSCYEESKDFQLFIDTPAIQPAEKVGVLEALAQKYSYDTTSVNYLKVLIENKRLPQLKKMVDNFENFYRAEKGQLMCEVTSATALSNAEKTSIETALKSRVKDAKTQLVISYNENASIEGGLVVKMGESVLDFSVSSKLDKLVAKLVAPI